MTENESHISIYLPGKTVVHTCRTVRQFDSRNYPYVNFRQRRLDIPKDMPLMRGLCIHTKGCVTSVCVDCACKLHGATLMYAVVACVLAAYRWAY